MPKIMIINVTHPEESRVGIVTDGLLTSFEIESFSREHLKGNIYKAVVHRVQPALEAAFVDIGADRDAFLPLDEVCFRNLPGAPARESTNGGEGRRRPKINELLKTGDEVLVQIVKEQFATKPPTLSTYFSLAGRYLVLLPGSDEAGISRRIEGAERQRVRALIEQLNAPEGFGIIVRTVAGFDPGARELERDLTYLRRLWDSIQQAAALKRAPALIYREHDLVLRNIRDYFTPDIDEVHIDNEDVFQRAREFFRDVMPEREGVLHLYAGDQPIFSHFNVETQIESVYKRRVSLKSGGSIVIDGTEALTAIDVNSGRSVRGASQEDTAVRTNLEAAAEIARQLRLRDLGGLIVIDFIDMRNQSHVTEVERALRAAMHADKARHEVGRISQFGLLEVSRQRLRPAAAATSYVTCQQCDGHGLVRTTESAALVALRKVHIRVAQGDVAAVRVSLPAEVGLYLLNQKREDLAQLERRYAARIQVVLSEGLMPHQIEMESRARVDAEATVAASQVKLGGVTPVDAAAPAEEAPAAAASAPESAGNGASAAGPGGSATGQKRKRRRGRRRGRGKQAAAIGAALGAGTGMAETPAPAGAATESDRPETQPAPDVGASAETLATAPAADTGATTPTDGAPTALPELRAGPAPETAVAAATEIAAGSRIDVAGSAPDSREAGPHEGPQAAAEAVDSPRGGEPAVEAGQAAEAPPSADESTAPPAAARRRRASSGRGRSRSAGRRRAGSSATVDSATESGSDPSPQEPAARAAGGAKKDSDKSPQGGAARPRRSAGTRRRRAAGTPRETKPPIDPAPAD